ncbi:ribosome-binding factor A-domain-containing protein [Scenedesmus sp. NREL 46B-D3]|nr:ribosome-binding factor A-domain-containing protein [Scenedesmus sp. NREL 46B-D3]
MHSTLHAQCSPFGISSRSRPGSTAGAPARLLSASRPPQQRGEVIICMAHPRRVAKVSSQIQREISEMFIYDKVVQEAICPERRAGLDDKLSAVASITHVYVSNDLQVVKVYVSVYSDEMGKERAIANLKRIAPYVRGRIGQALKLRLTPEVRFEHDNSLDELERVSKQQVGITSTHAWNN